MSGVKRMIDRARRKLGSGDVVNSVRRHTGYKVDRFIVFALSGVRRFRGGRKRNDRILHDEGPSRIALITVNYSTTRFLQLMLLTIVGQRALDHVRRIIVVDNGSRDGGLTLLRLLDRAVDRIHLIERRHFLGHAQGMRAGLAELVRLDSQVPVDERCDLVLFCDADVIFLSPDALSDLERRMTSTAAAFAGEFRGPDTDPDVQASFLAVRLEALSDSRVTPPVHHGSPTLLLQRSLLAAGYRAANFPSNQGGFILHRGRVGVAAAARHHRAHPYATAVNTTPHYMDVPDGERIWAEVERRWEHLLGVDARDAFSAHLSRRLAGDLGTLTEPSAAAPFDPRAPLVQAACILHRTSGGGDVLLDPRADHAPLTLLGTGPQIWGLFEKPRSPAYVVEALAARHLIPADEIRSHVENFIKELLDAGLLEHQPTLG